MSTSSPSSLSVRSMTQAAAAYLGGGRVQRVQLRRQVPRWARPLQVPARYKGASGGRASGKSHFFAEEAVECMVKDPDLRFVCIREVQRSLKFSAKALIESKIRSMGVAHLFDITLTEIRRVGGRGVMIFEGMQDHTADSIKSLEGFGRAWVEEAQNISQRSLDLLLPTIRAEGSEIWFSWNPASPMDPVDVFFAVNDERPDPDMVRTRCTYLDNPFCPAVMHKEAERLRKADEDLYKHIWLGEYFLGGKGRVYSNFADKPYPAGSVDDTVKDHGGELLIGMDFNVNPMTAVVGVDAGGDLLVLEALEIATSNTEEMAEELKLRYPGRRIIVCPDPAGNQRRSSAKAGETDFTILRRAGFIVDASTQVIPVVDRINAVQLMLLDRTTGTRSLRIHPRAKVLRTALSGQVYKESLPDKKSGFDHVVDALGYLVWQRFNRLQGTWKSTKVS